MVPRRGFPPRTTNLSIAPVYEDLEWKAGGLDGTGTQMLRESEGRMTGRPRQDEAAEFYWKYIDQVVGDDPVAAMVAQLDELTVLAGQFSEERSLYRYAGGKWSVREALNHLADAERVFQYRALWFARGLPDELPQFDENAVVAAAEADRVAWATHVEDYRKVRASTISLFGNLPEAAWSRVGVASGWPVSVRGLAFIMPDIRRITSGFCGYGIWNEGVITEYTEEAFVSGTAYRG